MRIVRYEDWAALMTRKSDHERLRFVSDGRGTCGRMCPERGPSAKNPNPLFVDHT